MQLKLNEGFYPNFLIRWLLTTIFLVAATLLINVYVDPLWFFTHQNSSNEKQWGFDERQQKTNWITGHSYECDALLLGSSRSTVINQQLFVNNKVFNYSASGMRPGEYLSYIRYAKKLTGGRIKKIYLGMDFFATNALHVGEAGNPDYYFNNAGSVLYKIGTLLSWDALKKTKVNLVKPKDDYCDCYDRNNVKTLDFRSDYARDEAIAKDISEYQKRLDGEGYKYSSEFLKSIRAIRLENPGVELIAFTTPEYVGLWDVLIKSGRKADRERWLAEMNEVFDEVYDFMGATPITTLKDNYVDGGHFKPVVGDLIVSVLEGRSNRVDIYKVVAQK